MSIEDFKRALSSPKFAGFLESMSISTEAEGPLSSYNQAALCVNGVMRPALDRMWAYCSRSWTQTGPCFPAPEMKSLRLTSTDSPLPDAK